jgi:hypothetical protein
MRSSPRSRWWRRRRQGRPGGAAALDGIGGWTWGRWGRQWRLGAPAADSFGEEARAGEAELTSVAAGRGVAGSGGARWRLPAARVWRRRAGLKIPSRARVWGNRGLRGWASPTLTCIGWEEEQGPSLKFFLSVRGLRGSSLRHFSFENCKIAVVFEDLRV